MVHSVCSIELSLTISLSVYLVSSSHGTLVELWRIDLCMYPTVALTHVNDLSLFSVIIRLC